MLEHYLIPLGPYVLQILGLVATVLLFSSVEKEISRLRSRPKERQTEPADLRDLHIQIAELQARVQHAEERPIVTVPESPVRVGLNAGKRTQVIRLSRRGEPAAHIAAAVGVPRQEVELLLKVYGLVLNSSNEVTTR